MIWSANLAHAALSITQMPNTTPFHPPVGVCYPVTSTLCFLGLPFLLSTLRSTEKTQVHSCTVLRWDFNSMVIRWDERVFGYAFLLWEYIEVVYTILSVVEWGFLWIFYFIKLNKSTIENIGISIIKPGYLLCVKCSTQTWFQFTLVLQVTAHSHL